MSKQAIVNALTKGEAILLTGAGFSRGMTDTYGDPLPLGTELAESIWPIGFGKDEHYSPDADLADVFDAAMATSSVNLRDQLERHFVVDRESLPERYKTWFSLPWHRIYTLNIDDGDEAVTEVHAAVSLQVVSAQTSSPGTARSDQLCVVHLNGRLADFPQVTFSRWDFARRTAHADLWYPEFAADFAGRNVVIVGSIVDEPPLWHFLQSRGARTGGPEWRPKSWLVTPTLNPARKAMLEKLNIDHIPLTEEQFFEQYLAAPSAKIIENAPARGVAANDEDLFDVATAVREATPGSADFLLGFAPTWGDVTNGFAADFESDHLLLESISQLSVGNVAVIGNAASGKTATMMKAAASLSAAGNDVVWLGRDANSSLQNLRLAVSTRKPDYLFIDDLDRFSGAAAGFIKGLQRDNDALVIIVGTRSVLFDRMQYADSIGFDSVLKLDRLDESDANALVAQLERGHRLGNLLSLTKAERVRKIIRDDDRQLLVALFSATQSASFKERIATECAGLTGAALVLYGVLCTATAAENKPIPRSELLSTALSSSFAANDALIALKQLEDARLISRRQAGYYPRHRVIAESALDYFRETGEAKLWIIELILLAAGRYERSRARETRWGRLLIRLISHEELPKLLGSKAEVRHVYGAVEFALHEDFHFWLQRGSFEIDRGEFAFAENYLHQAKPPTDHDPLVSTAWGHLLLKRAVQHPTSETSKSEVSKAFELLFPIMDNQESRSPHTFATFLIYALQWLKAAPLDAGEQRLIREQVRHYGIRGKLLHQRVQDVQAAWDEASRYLETNAVLEREV